MHGSVLNTLSKANVSGSDSQQITSKIVDSHFRGNQGPQLIYTFRTSLELTNVSATRNFNSRGEASPFEFVSSNLTITGSEFEGAPCSGASINGGILWDVGDNNLTISDSSFSNSCALNGGALYSGGFSSIQIKRTTFSNCSSLKRGGAIYSLDSSSLTIASSSFRNNRASIAGGDIFVTEALSSPQIT